MHCVYLRLRVSRTSQRGTCHSNSSVLCSQAAAAASLKIKQLIRIRQACGAADWGGKKRRRMKCSEWKWNGMEWREERYQKDVSVLHAHMHSVCFFARATHHAIVRTNRWDRARTRTHRSTWPACAYVRTFKSALARDTVCPVSYIQNTVCHVDVTEHARPARHAYLCCTVLLPPAGCYSSSGTRSVRIQ